MISPELMVIAILIFVVIDSVLNIAVGAMKAEKESHYGNVHVVGGIIGLLVVMFCIII